MTVNLSFSFIVPREVIYQALVDRMKVMQYTRANAQIENKQGGKYSILDGKIVGKFVTLKVNQYIKMEWKFNQWKEYSIVEIILRDPEDDECELIINQSKIPAGQSKEKLEQGWRYHIIEPLSKILGYAFRD